MSKLNYYIPIRHKTINSSNRIGNAKVTIVQNGEEDSFRLNDFKDTEITIKAPSGEELADQFRDSFESRKTKLTERLKTDTEWYSKEDFIIGTSTVYINGVAYWIDDDDYEEITNREVGVGIRLKPDADGSKVTFDDDDEIVIMAVMS